MEHIVHIFFSKCFSIIGRHEIILRPGDKKLEDLIDCEFDENRQPILDRIRKNITYYLGNAVEFHLLSKAAETLFNRDYKDKKQIFVPECFISKNPEILFYEKEELEKLLKTMSDDDMSKAEKGKMRCRIKTMEGEALEKKVYDTLKSYFQRHSGQHVLVIHGYEIMVLILWKQSWV